MFAFALTGSDLLHGREAHKGGTIKSPRYAPPLSALPRFALAGELVFFRVAFMLFWPRPVLSRSLPFTDPPGTNQGAFWVPSEDDSPSRPDWRAFIVKGHTNKPSGRSRKQTTT